MQKIYHLPALLLFSAIYAKGQTFLNPSFETWGNATACEVNVTPDNWINYSNAGIEVDEANFSYCPTTIPPAPADGNTYLRSYAGNTISGEGFYQIVSGFTPGNSYMITYNYAGSNLYGGLDPVQWHIFIDDVDVNTSAIFQSTDAAWNAHSYVFMATAASHKIGFRLYSTIGTGSGAIDHIDLSEATGILPQTVINGISVFPTLVADVLIIRLNRDLKVTVINNLGQEVLISPVTRGYELTVDVSGLEKGIYMVRMEGENEVMVRRFVKQ